MIPIPSANVETTTDVIRGFWRDCATRGAGCSGAVEVAGNARFAGLVLDLLDTAELDMGATAAFFDAHAAMNEVFGQAGAVAFAQFARAVQMMLIDGSVGLVLAPGGRLSRALKFELADGKIVNAEIIADPARLTDLDLAVLE